MESVTYYTSMDKKFTLQSSLNPTWYSLCHNQPNMDNVPIFLDIENELAYGLCRRCGKESRLTHDGLNWLNWLYECNTR
jgi:hypothetical protein